MDAILSLTLVFVAILAASIPLENNFLYFSAIYGLFAILPYYSKTWRGEFDLFRPYHVMIILLYFYSLSTLEFVQLNGHLYHGESVGIEDINIYIQCCILGAAGLSIGTIIGNRYRNDPKQFLLKENANSSIIYVGLFFGMVFFPTIYEKFTPWSASSYGDMALATRVHSLDDKAAGLKEIVTITVPIFFILCASIIVAFDRTRYSFFAKLISLVILVSYISTAFLSGWRSQMMAALVMMAMYYQYSIKKLPIKLIIGSSIAIYFIINALSIMRGSSDPFEMIRILSETIDERGFEIFGISQSGELATSTNLIRLIQGMHLGETDYGYGINAINQLIAIIPRIIYPERPPIASELFVQTFYPGVYEMGGGYGFFILQDGYWDFGLVGVFLYSIAFGVFTEALYWRFMKLIADPFWILFYGIIYYQLVFSSIRSGNFASIKAAAIIGLPIYIVYILAIRNSRKLFT